MQGFLSRDGMPPAEFLAVGRREVAGYGVELVSDQVLGIEPGFLVRLAGGRACTARRILLATGAGDELPDIPGVRQRWGRDLLHCPYCHGWEVRDQPLGVLGTQPGSVQHALLVRQWSDDVIFFAHTYDLTSTERRQLRARGVQIVDGRVARLVVQDDRLTGVELADGQVIGRTAVFIRPGNTPHDDGLLAGLGCELDGAGFPRRRHRPDQRARRLGGRQPRRSTCPGDHLRWRRIRGGIAINADLVQQDAERAVDDLDNGDAAFSAAMMRDEYPPFRLDFGRCVAVSVKTRCRRRQGG